MAFNGTSPKRRKRLRAIEELYLNGYGASEIYDLIGKTFGVVYGTIRNDIGTVRKSWDGDVDEADEKEGRRRYLASLRSNRRRATRNNDLGMLYKIDQELARFSGFRLAGDTRTYHISIEKARSYIDNVMNIIFDHVEDKETQDKIIADLERLADGERDNVE